MYWLSKRVAQLLCCGGLQRTSNLVESQSSFIFVCCLPPSTIPSRSEPLSVLCFEPVREDRRSKTSYVISTTMLRAISCLEFLVPPRSVLSKRLAFLKQDMQRKTFRTSLLGFTPCFWELSEEAVHSNAMTFATTNPAKTTTKRSLKRAFATSSRPTSARETTRSACRTKPAPA